MAEEVAAPETAEPDETQANKTGKPTMTVKVFAPFKVFFEGSVFSISAVNATGPFDILPKHHNFLCMLVPCTLTVRPVEGDDKLIKINRALMHVKADSIHVFMDV